MLTLFLTFFQIGLFTFGGGYAMIPMIKAATIARGWIDLEGLVDFIAISESTPGPFAVNIATFIGMEQGGLLHAAVATLGVVLPSFLILLVVGKFFYGSFQNNRFVKGALSGLRPAVVGSIAAAALSVGISTLLPAYGAGVSLGAAFATFNWRGLAILGLIFGLSQWKKKMHPILLIAVSAILGLVFFGLFG